MSDLITTDSHKGAILKDNDSKKSLKILKVIHGFPPDFMAGSEVYSYNLCKELARLNNECIFLHV